VASKNDKVIEHHMDTPLGEYFKHKETHPNTLFQIASLFLHFQDQNYCHCFPKVNMNKFNGFDPIDWVTQMEHYFSLHRITNDLLKLNMGVLYLDSEHWKWRK
jgi:hypothetical protein